jgi:HAD superfamily hydrolase (TIGR01490 family)
MEITSSVKNSNARNYIVFFDLDRTITKATSGRALTRHAWKKGLMSFSNLIKAIGISVVYRLKIGDSLKIIDEMVSWVKDIPEKTMDSLCSEIFHEVLLPLVHPEVKTEIKVHKDKNAKVVILSSSLVPVCREMADYLEMDDIICSELEIMFGKYTGRPLGRLCFGDEKVARLKEYCEKNYIAPGEAWYYGDSISDLPVLSIVGNPVCINPDKKLLREARKNKWKIYKW